MSMIHAEGCSLIRTVTGDHSGPCVSTKPDGLDDSLATPITEATGAHRQESVDHPSHYGGDTVYETIKVLEAWLTPEQFEGFLLGNYIKYVSRLGKKGDPVEDAKKALWYLNRYLAYKA